MNNQEKMETNLVIISSQLWYDNCFTSQPGSVLHNTRSHQLGILNFLIVLCYSLTTFDDDGDDGDDDGDDCDDKYE